MEERAWAIAYWRYKMRWQPCPSFSVLTIQQRCYLRRLVKNSINEHRSTNRTPATILAWPTKEKLK